VNRTQRLTVAVGVFAIVTVLGAAAGAQEPKKSVQPANPPTGVSAVAPEAAAVIDRMGTYLQTLSAFAIHAETTTDEVLLVGPKVQFGGTIDGTFRAPDGLRLRVAHDDADPQEFFYNGATLAVWVEAKKLWASVPMTGKVGDAIMTLESKYDVTFPLGVLLARAVRKDLLKDVEAGVVIGTGRVAGVECDHVGFHQADVDWQLWIEKGARPLPRKLVITTLDEPIQPQHTEILTWDLSPKIDATMFTFVPPAGAQRIVIAERVADKVATPAAAAKKEVK
jgi:hypothetical protein